MSNVNRITDITNVLIDMDGTLLNTNHYYHIPQLRCAEIIYNEMLDKSPRLEDIFYETDAIRKQIQASTPKVPLDHFEQSWGIYYKKLCSINGMTPKKAVVNALYEQASKYVQTEYTMMQGVADALKRIPYNKILVTLGNLNIQTRKIESATIDKHIDTIEIVGAKNVNTYTDLLAKYKINPAQAVMIGDNFKLDILPAMTAGLKAIHILGPYQEPQKIELNFGRYHSCRSFLEVPEMLGVDAKA